MGEKIPVRSLLRDDRDFKSVMYEHNELTVKKFFFLRNPKQIPEIGENLESLSDANSVSIRLSKATPKKHKKIKEKPRHDNEGERGEG